jgi:hypothetical protein
MGKKHTAGAHSERSCPYILCLNNMTMQNVLEALSRPLGEQSKLMSLCLLAHSNDLGVLLSTTQVIAELKLKSKVGAGSS